MRRQVSAAPRRLTLRQSLGRTHLVAAITAVSVAGLFFTLVALLVVRFYAAHNLERRAKRLRGAGQQRVVAARTV